MRAGGRASPTTPAIKRRRTATEVERERMRREEAREKNWIREIINRWRCTNERCEFHKKGCCLVYPGENQCRPLGQTLLARWNERLSKGQGSVDQFPADAVGLPPLGKKPGRSQVEAGSSAMSAMPPSMFYPPPPIYYQPPPPAPLLRLLFRSLLPRRREKLAPVPSRNRRPSDLRRGLIMRLC